MSFETFSERAIKKIAENKIEAAMQEGEFDNLPGFGKPFEFDELHYDPHWWIRRKMRREQLNNLFRQSPEITPDSSS